MTLEDAPPGIVRRRRDNPDVMTASGKPFSHFSGVLADTSQFGPEMN
jgi:hypothetical protein